MGDIVIGDRFRGPPQSGNGGYVGGVFSRLVNPSGLGNVEVTLRAPIPLDKGMQGILGGEGSARIMDGDSLIAEVRAQTLDLDVPDKPDAKAIDAAAEHSYSFTENVNALIPGRRGFHPICFCCGAEHDEGLKVFAAPVGDQVAAHWQTQSDWADEDGLLPAEYLWTALDCPGQFAFLATGVRTGLLGRITVRIDKRPTAGSLLTVTAWPIEVDGKKHFAGSAVFDETGQVVACAKSVWIGRQN